MPSEPGLKRIYKEDSPTVDILEEHWKAYFAMLEKDYGLSLEQLRKDWEEEQNK